MKNLQKLAPAALAICLAACGGEPPEALPKGTVGLRITSEVPSKVKADRISVIPNDVAPWISQILLLADGQLYRTTANGGQAQAVNGGTLKDMVGLMRKGEAGTVLTLTREGKLSAMIEKDDEGRLARMNVSAKSENYDGFCQGYTAPSDTVYAYSGKTLVTLGISYESDSLMRVERLETQNSPKPITSCLMAENLSLIVSGGELYVNGASAGRVGDTVSGLGALSVKSTPTLVYVDGDTLIGARQANPDLKSKVVIEDGLSVMGTKNISHTFTTGDSLGGTFNEGAVILQDSSSDRLILVARPFAQQALSKAPKK
jgi:hypothetical protein